MKFSIRQLCSRANEYRKQVVVHLHKWKSLYEVIGIFAAIVISALSLGATRQAISQTQQSLSISERSLALTEQSVDLQQKEFKLRNRPLVTVCNWMYVENFQNFDGVIYPHAIRYSIINLSDIPAIGLHGKSYLSLNGRLMHGSIHLPCSLAKGADFISNICLRNDEYEKLTNVDSRVELVTELFYGGMLGESNNEYQVTSMQHYKSSDKLWENLSIEFR